jgi:hypothetical protein
MHHRWSSPMLWLMIGGPEIYIEPYGATDYVLGQQTGRLEHDGEL